MRVSYFMILGIFIIVNMKVENIAKMKIKNSRELLMMEKAESIKRDQQIRK